ncbi:hypothetical protein VPH35_077925 [Triticum aestivum]
MAEEPWPAGVMAWGGDDIGAWADEARAPRTAGGSGALGSSVGALKTSACGVGSDAPSSMRQEKFYTAEATIKSIDTSDEWYYIGCGKCNKKLQKEGNHFYCPKCEKEPEKTCPSTVTKITLFIELFLYSEEDSSVQHANVEQNTTKGTKKARTRNTCRVVHSDEESEEDSQEKDECKFKESSPKRKRTISIIEDGDSEKDGTENYSKTSIRLTSVDKGSKKKGIRNDNHEQVNKLSLSKTIKQESEDDELTIDQSKRSRRRSTGRAANLDGESKAEGAQEINKSKSMESSPKRKRVVTRQCASVDNKPVNNHHEEKTEKEGNQEHNDSRPRTRLSSVDKKSLCKGI